MNGARHLTVSVAPSHLASLARCAPSVGIEELIWNALDADATDVRVRLLEQGALHDVGRVEVKDNGTGIDVTRVDQSFSALGWSWKKPGRDHPRRSSPAWAERSRPLSSWGYRVAYGTGGPLTRTWRAALELHDYDSG